MEDRNATPDEDPKMTNPDQIKLKLIATLIEAIDTDDDEDVQNAILMIAAILKQKPAE